MPSQTDASRNTVSPTPAPRTDASRNTVSPTPAPRTDASRNTVSPTPAPRTDASRNTVSPPKKDSSGNKVPVPKKTNSDDNNLLLDIFNKSNIVLILWFLAIYLVIYFLVELFRNPTTQPGENKMASVARTFDLVILLVCTIYLIATYYYKTEKEKEDWIEYWTIWFLEEVDKPSSIVSMFVFIIVFYLLIYLVGIPMDYDTKPISVFLIELTVWKTIIIAIIFVFFRMVLNISLKEYFEDLFYEIWYPGYKKRKSLPPVDVSGKTQEVVPKEEVFNVDNNLYTYEDAQTVCKAYNSRLATYDEVEQAYNKGAEWCNYGWSEGQMAFFPTQKKTWDKLQKMKGRENSCGRPGVNGGYIDNPYARFGINCFGVKPKPSAEEQALIDERKKNPDSVLPKTEEDKILEMKVKYWKENGDKIIKFNSFNNDKWSAY